MMTATELDTLIAKLGKALLTGDESFETIARQESGDLGISDLLRLDYKLHNNPPLPPDINERDLSLGQWLWTCQYAIFELIYNIGADALEYLKSVAFGEYDWPQSTALIILCRLYADGTLPVDIIKQIDDNFGVMRYETHLFFTRDLLQRKKNDPRFEDVFNQLKNPHFLYAITELGEGLEKISMTRDELIELGKRIIAQDEVEEDMQALMDAFDANVPYPKGSRLFYFPEGYDGNVDELEYYNPTVEQVVDKCLSYTPRGDENGNTLPFPLL